MTAQPAAASEENSAAAVSQKRSQNKPDTRSDDVAVFRSRVNLVMVPVVVRDSRGNSIGDLRREDFHLFDAGKPQVIRHFAIERPAPREEAPVAAVPANGAAKQKSEEKRVVTPPRIARRFVAWMIDDYHLDDMAQVLAVRQAADRMVETLRPGDRVAMYTASGNVAVDFTDDIPALHRAITRLHVTPSAPGLEEAKNRKNDPTLNPSLPPNAELEMLDERPLQLLEQLVRALTIRPGDRSIVMISPGYLPMPNVAPRLPEVIDRAIQANVVINTLDTRGVYGPSFLDPSKNTIEGAKLEDIPASIHSAIRQDAAQNLLLEYLADGTGGVFFHSDNDLYEGLRRTTEAAEYRYVLGFSPKEWHSDYDFHRLKVKVDRPGVEIQARRGYSLESPDGSAVATGGQKKATPTPSQAESQAAGTSAAQVATAPVPDKDSSHELPSFKSRVDLVMVPVVVRDSKGNALGSLRRENFRVFDNGKPQIIKQFSAESAATRAAAATRKTEANSGEAKNPVAPAVPRRFIAYVFDDLHLDMSDFAQARKAAERQLAALEPGERVALYTTSGHQTVEFTEDAAKLREALLRVIPRSASRECPDLGAHWAGQIQEVGYQPDHPLVKAATAEYDRCSGGSELRSPRQKQSTAGQSDGGQKKEDLNLRRLVDRIVGEAQRDAQISTNTLTNVVARMTALPGERVVVTVSSGFTTPDQKELLDQVIERAVQARVAVNTLDARGVYTPSMFDASNGIESTGNPSPDAMKFRMEEASLQREMLQELADGTGGVFHGNNDLNEGFRKAAGVAEFTYMLGFTPELTKDPKADPYHKLKVKIEDAGHGLTIQARRSYMVNTAPVDPAREEEQQIRDAMYSREDMTEIPMTLSTEVSKVENGDSRLKVTVHLDLKNLPLRKEEDRNKNDLEIHAGVFDRNGKYLTGKGNKVELRLLDQTVARVNSGAPLAQGSNLDMDFALKPGDYVVRVVVREAENQLMSAASSTVQIP